jgi:nucleoid-associated protein YgaU
MDDTSGNVQHAKLEIEGQGVVKCRFNPKEYSITKSNTWTPSKVKGNSRPGVEFGGGQPRELSVELLLDASDSDKGSIKDDAKKLFAMMEVDDKLGSGAPKNTGRPPKVTLAWGDAPSFEAFAKSLTVQYTLFRQNGDPMRALVKLTLVQAEKAQDGSDGSQPSKAGQNPTTRALPALGAHVVRDGDSLPSIANAAYGDPTRWREIADANGIDDPLRLSRGARLSIPRGAS